MKPTNKKGTNSPAVLDAPSPDGLRSADLKTEIVSQSAGLIRFLIQLAVVGGIGWLVYSKYTNRFVSKPLNSNYPDSNISDGQAQARAVAIEQSKGIITTDFEAVSRQLSGLNYNGFVKLYNAFGKHTGTYLGGELDLIAWLENQFSEQEFTMLGALQNHSFF